VDEVAFCFKGQFEEIDYLVNNFMLFYKGYDSHLSSASYCPPGTPDGSRGEGRIFLRGSVWLLFDDSGAESILNLMVWSF
jgi:hypothetical protein